MGTEIRLDTWPTFESHFSAQCANCFLSLQLTTARYSITDVNHESYNHPQKAPYPVFDDPI